MISIKVPSKLDEKKLFLQAQLSQLSIEEGFVVDEIFSPLSGVYNNYLNEIKSSFNYSFVNKYGYYESVGFCDEKLRNLLILLAREYALNKRKVLFKFEDETVTEIVNKKDIIYGLKTDAKLTISQLEKIFDGQQLSLMGLWLFFFFHTLIQDNSSTREVLTESLLSSNVLSKVIYSIDPKFFFQNARKGTYAEIRRKISDEESLNKIAYFSTGLASNDTHWRITDAVIAARNVNGGNVIDKELFDQLLKISNTKVAPIHYFFLRLLLRRLPHYKLGSTLVLWSCLLGKRYV